ncbi:SDR family NAD(P)-dependent oxidoreductase [Streptomyces sp. NBRC 109706]|uniref:SDR family NAD(P)-dependent oxidoreductase n=1 Tax=Streptomyces sp. NBRC 109706 TaxID=1550035 RepID=UPI0008340439|nr:SDR family NAD(P)-dependent oxidoreductase [Streptomyces sp. NBRC 109706]
MVVTGGTSGIGKGIAAHYLRQGAHVIAVGSSEQRGAVLRAEAQRAAWKGKLTVLRVDLSSVAAGRRLVDSLVEAEPILDNLVLCAQRYRLTGGRVETAEGFEHSFALAYLSRYVLSHGLLPALERSPGPVIANVGTPGLRLGRIHWDDLQLTRRYGGTRATLQSFRANDLLGAAFPQVRPDSAVRYVGYHPGVVRTGMPASQPQPLRALSAASLALLGRGVEQAIRPLVALLDDPPEERFTAHRGRRRLSVDRPTFDTTAALRLHRETQALLD